MIYDAEGRVYSFDTDVGVQLAHVYPPNNWNVFYITCSDNAYPLMQLNVMGDIAVLHFFPSENVAGFASIGGRLGLPWGEQIAFPESRHGAEMFFLSNAVISKSEAVMAVCEFLETGSLPQSIRWLQL